MSNSERDLPYNWDVDEQPHETEIETGDLPNSKGKLYVAKCSCGWVSAFRGYEPYVIADAQRHKDKFKVR